MLDSITRFWFLNYPSRIIFSKGIVRLLSNRLLFLVICSKGTLVTFCFNCYILYIKCCVTHRSIFNTYIFNIPQLCRRLAKLTFIVDLVRPSCCTLVQYLKNIFNNQGFAVKSFAPVNITTWMYISILCRGRIQTRPSVTLVSISLISVRKSISNQRLEKCYQNNVMAWVD